jgi:AcrR family transcriptional regulator
MTQSNRPVEDAFAASLRTSDLTDKQQAVLTACLALFSRKGFDATSTKDIAQLAHVSEGTVYKKYRSKQGLLDALLAPLATVVVPRLAKEFMGEITLATIPRTFGRSWILLCATAWPSPYPIVSSFAS